MNEVDIKEKIREIEEQIKENELHIKQLDIKQYVLKILINSSYGAISNQSNPIGNDRLANAITGAGSTSIKKVNDIAKAFVSMKRSNKKDDTFDYSKVVVANDTDSAYISLAGCGVNMFNDGLVTDEGYKLAAECDDFINKEFVKWYSDISGSKNVTINFKREKICDTALFLKKKDKDEEAKKNYVLHVIDDEDTVYKNGKFKYTGVKFKRSVIPAALKDAGKKVVENMILTGDMSDTNNLLSKIYEDYKVMNLDDKAIIQRCNNMEKYKTDADSGYVSGTPGHIRAAMNFNRVIKAMNLKKYQEIKSGDMAKIVFLKPNKFEIDKIAYLDAWPKEFDNVFIIDDAVTFKKTIFDEIARFYKSVDWPTFDPTKNYSLNLLDLLGC